MGYYPPKTFKIAVYLPSLDKIIISDEEYERVAFEEKYNVDLSNYEMEIHHNFSYRYEIISFLKRCGITLLIEVLLALIFNFKTKKHLAVLIITNVLTQILLNVGLLISSDIFSYLFLEILIIFIEMWTYLYFFDNKKLWIMIYTILANIITFLVGIYAMIVW